MKWLQKLDRKLETTIEQLDRAANEPVRKILSGEVFVNEPDAPIFYDVFADEAEQSAHTVTTTDHQAATQPLTSPCCQPTGETV